MSATVRVALDNIEPRYFQPVRSALTGGDVFRDRPAACSDPFSGIAGYAEAHAQISEAQERLRTLKEEIQACHLKALAIEAERADLMRRVRLGEKPAPGAASELDVKQSDVTATVNLINTVVKVAEGDLKAAHQHRKVLLRRAAGDYLDLLREMLHETSAEMRAVRNKQAALESWSREVQTMLQHQLDEEQLEQVLGL